jgi:hypothetical protein
MSVIRSKQAGKQAGPTDGGVTHAAANQSKEQHGKILRESGRKRNAVYVEYVRDSNDITTSTRTSEVQTVQVSEGF